VAVSSSAVGTCAHCGGELLTDGLFCPGCGSPVRTDASVMMPLAALRPEAEPPLPAEHELLRMRTPVPGVEPQTRIERIATPSRPVPATTSSPKLEPLEVSPLSRVERSPLLGVASLDPVPELPPPEIAHAVPSLTGGSRRGLIAVLVLLAVGGAVGWLLSRDPPPTADELRAKTLQQHTPE
jgi:hypothetical protein